MKQIALLAYHVIENKDIWAKVHTDKYQNVQTDSYIKISCYFSADTVQQSKQI